MIISSYTFLGKYLTRVLVQPCNLLRKFQKRSYKSSTNDYGGSQLTQTTIFVQEGTDIQEVPVIVRKITDIKSLFEKESKKTPKSSSSCQQSHISEKDKRFGSIHKENTSYSTDKTAINNELVKQSIAIETDEGVAVLFYSDVECLKNTDVDQILDAVNSKSSNKKIHSLLEGKITDEINCRLALKGLKRMIELENGWHRYRKTMSNEQLSIEAINRDIILRQLVNIIIKSQDNGMIIEGLKALRRDRFNPSRNIYRDWMCNEAMIRATDGKFTLPQLISVVRILASYKDSKYRHSIDVLWIGIACREQDIKPNLLVPLFKLLKYFRQSKNMIQIILEKKLSEQWLQLTGSQMANILDCLHGKITSKKSLSSASKWASVSMTMSNEKDLVNFIRGLHVKEYIDENIEQALERYVQVKGMDMKDPHLVASIMEYCRDLKIRNPYILTECGKYFVKHGMEIAPSLLASVLTPFGLLNVHPANSIEFWKVFDEVISARFTDLKLNDVLDILLSCTYLERYPIQFTNKIFSSYFLNRLQVQRDAPILNRLKIKLQLFDATMSLECKDYQDSHVNIDTNIKALCLDMRIKAITNKICKPLAYLVGGEHKLSKSVVLSRLPLINFYILDILIHPLLKSMPVFNLNLHKRKNINTAILIHLPEYYCWNTRHLIGPQIMRQRQIRKLGFRVISLDYTKLIELTNETDKLSSYLSQSLDAAEDAL